MEMQLGVIALGQGRYSQAEGLFRKLYKEGSPDLQPLAGLVNTYEAEHMPDRALALMQRRDTTLPGFQRKRSAIGSHRGSGRQKRRGACGVARRWPSQNPTSAEVQVRIAALQQRNQQPARGPAGLRASPPAGAGSQRHRRHDCEIWRNSRVRTRKRSQAIGRLWQKRRTIRRSSTIWRSCWRTPAEIRRKLCRW